MSANLSSFALSPYQKVGWTRIGTLSTNWPTNKALSFLLKSWSRKVLISLVHVSKGRYLLFASLGHINSFAFRWKVPYPSLKQWGPQLQNHWGSFHYWAPTWKCSLLRCSQRGKFPDRMHTYRYIQTNGSTPYLSEAKTLAHVTGLMLQTTSFSLFFFMQISKNHRICGYD